MTVGSDIYLDQTVAALPSVVALPEFVMQVLDRVPPGNLFALVDAARDRSVYAILEGLPVEACLSLYEEKDKGQTLAAFAPHLVEISPSVLAQLAPLWGQDCLIFVASKTAFADLRKHFRRFLLVRADGKTLYFRFYDPRILPTFLFNAIPGELEAFVAQIEQFIIESDGGRSAVVFERDPRAPEARLTHTLLPAKTETSAPHG